MTDDLENESNGPESIDPELEAVSEEQEETASEAKVEAASQGEIEAEDSPRPEDDSEPEFTPKPRPPAKLERLQKILAAAGIASRRRAEELIEQGRVQVNGKIITELGTKADAGRDHIRVDGKLLQGVERHRYFVLNKPKGFVTTVKDPEGRPTVMQFFDKMKERLYPVGRLDYMSEGLLLVTNDGDLANRLTKASSGVEKTYLVKVAGQPTEDELDALRSGVAIERGKPGSAKVRTSPARVRQVRQGDNPWYEVILIEGRNRELRKMFEEIGHFVEKIRRIGYGPLVLDQEPGSLRELQPEDLIALREAAEGKLRTPKSKDLRRRNAMDAAGLPTVKPKPTVHPRPVKPVDPDAVPERSAATSRPGEFRPKKSIGPAGKDKARPSRPTRPTGEQFRPAARTGTGPAKFGAPRAAGRPAVSPAKRPFQRPETEGSFTSRPPRASRPAWKKDSPAARPPARFGTKLAAENRPSFDRPRPASPGAGRTGARPNFAAKPAWNKAGSRADRPAFKRPAGPRHEDRLQDEDLGPVRPPNLHIEEISGPDRSSHSDRPERTASARPSARSGSAPRPGSSPRPYSDRPESTRPSSNRPFRSEAGLPRAYTTSSGKPRAGGPRPSSKPGAPGSKSKPGGWKPGKPAGRPYSPGSSARSASGPESIDPRTGSRYRPQPGGRSSTGPAKRPFRGEGAGSFTPRPSGGSGPRLSSGPRPYTPRAEGASGRGSAPRSERKPGAGWKPKPSFGGPAKPASGSHSKPKPGGFKKSGYKAKPGGKPAGKRPGGKKRA